jgi:hypothetical protein
MRELRRAAARATWRVAMPRPAIRRFLLLAPCPLPAALLVLSRGVTPGRSACRLAEAPLAL